MTSKTRNIIIWSTIVVSVAVAAFFLLSCPSLGAGPDDALFAPIQHSWDGTDENPGVEQDVLRGLQDGFNDGDIDALQLAAAQGDVKELDAAIEDEDSIEVKMEWPPLRSWAERGVQDRFDDGQVSEGIKESFMERILQFSKAIDDLSIQ